MKKFFLSTIFLFLGITIFAQAAKKSEESEVEEEIELPDVTTVVNGKTFTVGKDSVPDYTKILPENSSPEVQLPLMENDGSEKTTPAVKNGAEQKSKDIYAEGELGAGYPFYFKGDFSVYRASGNSPFEIDFNHESAEGFAGKKSNEGYFARTTAVRGKQSLFTNYGKHRAEASYKMSDDGLQLKSNAYSDMVKHTIFADAGSDWNLSNGILISYGMDGAWFNRYGEIMKNSVTFDNFMDTTKIVDVNPYLGFGWTGKGFKAMLTSYYGFQGNLEKSGNLFEIENSSNQNSSHRGQFKLGLSWANDFLTLGADGSLIIGTATGEKDILPAFTGILDFKTESFTEGRFVTLSARGGLDSYQEKIRNLENKYRFAVAPAIPTETTDWFSTVDVSVPILSAFEAKAGFEFRKTAFENGLWEAEYNSEVPKSGLYIISTKERTEYDTNFGFYADFAPIKAGVEWKSYWKDVPALSDEHKIKASVEYQSLDAKWNVGTAGAVALGKEADKCPDLSVWAGVRLAPALSLAFEVNDVIKLCNASSRDYAHSGYITTSGNAVLLAKFQF